MDGQDQFDKWVSMWEKHQAEMQVPEKESTPTHSYFGMQSVLPDEEPSEERMLTESDHWRDIYNNALKINKMINEEENDNYLSKGPGKTDFTQNPVHFASHGQDQSPSPYEPVRVTPNFTDGEQLRNLHELKVKLEKLESSLLSADIKGETSNDYKSQLDKLRKQIDDLSDKLTPKPIEDVT